MALILRSEIEQHAVPTPRIIPKQPKNYEIVSLSPLTNQLAGQQETAPYLVSLSGGLGSAIAGERAIQRFGRENVLLWFSDVLQEDEDLHRFMYDLMVRWSGKLFWYKDGRKPEDVWESHRIIANNRMCPCSFSLKIQPCRAFMQSMPTLPQVLIGYKPDEIQRQKRTCASYDKAIPGSTVVYPLLWEPVEHRDLSVVCQEELDIVPPRVYALGFEYNNCGGDCCRAGIGGRVLEAIHFPERFQHSLEWEERMSAKGGALTGKTFCTRLVNGEKHPLSLREIQRDYVPLARAYLDAHPKQRVSEKTLVREMKKWDHQCQQRVVASEN